MATKKRSLEKLASIFRNNKIRFLELDADKRAAEETFKRHNARLLEQWELQKETLTEKERELREAVIQESERTGQTAVGPGMSTRQVAEIKVFSDKAALEWAHQWAPLALSLDLHVFRQLIDQGLVPEYIAKLTWRTTAVLAKDVGKEEE